MENDILEPIPASRLPAYLEVCRKKYPNSLRTFTYLINQIEWLKKRSDPKNHDKFISNQCLVEFYAPRGADIENCTIITASKAEKDFALFVYTQQDSLEELTSALIATKRINWDLRPVISSTLTKHMPALKKKFKHDNLRMGLEIPHYIMVLPKEEAITAKIEIPSEVYVAMLRVEDAKTIDDVWPHKHATSWKYISSLIMLNGGFGVYSKESDELLSWVLINDHLVPGTLQTKKSAARKGFAKIVMVHVAKYLAEKYDTDVAAYVKDGNVPSRKLLESLGYKAQGTCSWVLMSINSIEEMNHE